MEITVSPLRGCGHVSIDEKENIMAKNLCLIYQGIMAGVFDALQLDVDSEEIECVLLGGKHCTFKFDFITEELDDSLIDEDSEETVSDFLSSL